MADVESATSKDHQRQTRTHSLESRPSQSARHCRSFPSHISFFLGGLVSPKRCPHLSVHRFKGANPKRRPWRGVEPHVPEVHCPSALQALLVKPSPWPGMPARKSAALTPIGPLCGIWSDNMSFIIFALGVTYVSATAWILLCADERREL